MDANNNRRDNMISFHDVMKTYRWEVRFLSFVFGIAEANAFSCYKIWGNNSEGILHSEFKNRLAKSLLDKVKDSEYYSEKRRIVTRKQRSNNTHAYIAIAQYPNRKRLVCKTCKQLGLKPTRVSKRCACNSDPMCKDCHQQHFLKEITNIKPL